MNKKVLILSGSPRKGGNSDLLCGEFARGAQESGNEVEIIRVAAKKIAPCSGCYYCRAHNGECAHKDDMAEMLQKMIDADVIVMASPVYFYSIDAQLKVVIDRTVARWLEVKNKDFYYIITMADDDVSSADTTLACLRGYAACVRGAQENGVPPPDDCFVQSTHSAVFFCFDIRCPVFFVFWNTAVRRRAASRAEIAPSCHASRHAS